jgi:prevent-host-death family protein
LREPLAPLYSARRGEYRVLYRIEGERLVIEIVTIDELECRCRHGLWERDLQRAPGRSGEDDLVRGAHPASRPRATIAARTSSADDTSPESRAVTTHERFEITRNGARVAVLMSAEDYDALVETVDILSNPDACTEF